MINEEGTSDRLDDQVKRDVGLDVKYNVTSNLTFDGTINTDFAQVEADDQQINLTRFSLFFPEKRQFFQERSGIFAFTTTGSDRLFHSRQIGLYRGAVVPIVGGVRLIGRLGKWDVGAINMQTVRRSALDLPSENFGVVRLRRQVLNSVSTAGGMLTSRIGDDGSYNVAYGLDAVLNMFGHGVSDRQVVTDIRPNHSRCEGLQLCRCRPAVSTLAASSRSRMDLLPGLRLVGQRLHARTRFRKPTRLFRWIGPAAPQQVSRTGAHHSSASCRSTSNTK